ncbi:membrane protein [Brackiella oedipodis]|uniref:P-type ATPase n=1 Tax=Brackiella oedipodis TaxID=124225 RepID=UPI00048E04AA|nr:membrane protein [Brackiella oedipodis]
MSAPSIFALAKDLPLEQRLLRRRMLARLGLAWLIMMQVMMFAAPGYFRNSYIGTETLAVLDAAIAVMNWISLSLCVPAIFYCAMPIWQGLFQSKQLHGFVINMNWPIAIGIVISFIPSVVATLHHQGEVYYDSISMFIAFILTARYLEFCAAQSASVQSQSRQVVEQTYRIDSTRADKVAMYFVTAQILLALVTGIVWYVFINPEHAVAVTISCFVMSCPCAMAMAVPTSYAGCRTLLVRYPDLTTEQTTFAVARTHRTAMHALYISLAWHLLMMPLAMIGYVLPWVAAVIMFVSSMFVAAYAWHNFRHIEKKILWQKEQAAYQRVTQKG